jgi:hypothetical protein
VSFQVCDHATQAHTANEDGKHDELRYNENVPARYLDVPEYSTPSGLMTITRCRSSGEK